MLPLKECGRRWMFGLKTVECCKQSLNRHFSGSLEDSSSVSNAAFRGLSRGFRGKEGP